MKYLNQLNALLAIVSALVVAYTLTETVWGPEPTASLNILTPSGELRDASMPAGSIPPDRRLSGPQRKVAPGAARHEASKPEVPVPVEPVAGVQEESAGDTQEPVPPAAAADPAPAFTTTGNTMNVVTTSGPSTDAGTKAENKVAERLRPRAVEKRPSALSMPARSTPRLPSGRAGFPGGAKRDRQDGPGSPPVRSSFPSQRLP